MLVMGLLCLRWGGGIVLRMSWLSGAFEGFLCFLFGFGERHMAAATRLVDLQLSDDASLFKSRVDCEALI